MTAPPITVTPTTRVHEAARLMLDEHVNRLPVVLDGKLVGIVTRADVVRAFARPDAEIVAEIRDEILQRTFWVRPGEVNVSVVDGRVELEGSVETDADAEMLPVFVARVPGVVSVHSDLRTRTAVA
jgi:CBS domain-containing protein